MNKIIYVYKEKGYTSFDVCNKLKRVFHTKKIGHTGTLDPNAEGLLICMINSACKLLPYIAHSEKTYVATIRLGEQYDTLDIFGELTTKVDYIKPDINKVNEVLMSFLGESEQIPPMVSAKKINGKKLYELHREGIEVERKPCKINIKDIKLLSFDDEIKFEVTCSAGTYIRSLIDDFGHKIGIPCTMSSLIRTKIDDIDLSMAYHLQDIEEGNFKCYDYYDILSKYYHIYEYDKIEDVKNGKTIKINSDDDIIMISHNNEIIAAYEKLHGNIYKSKRGLW